MKDILLYYALNLKFCALQYTNICKYMNNKYMNVQRKKT